MSIDPDDPVHEKFESVTGEPLGAYFGSIGDSIMTMLQARGRRGAEGDFAARACARLSAAPSLTRALAGSLPPPPPLPAPLSAPRVGTQVLTLDSWVSALARPLGQELGLGAWVFFVSYMIFASLGFLNLMTAVFVNSLVELTNADEHRRQQIHREWIGYARDVCAELFALCDEDGDGCLTRAEIMRTLTLMVRRRNMVMRNEQILNDQLTRVMVRMSNADVDFDSMLSAISRFLTKAGVNEMTLSEFTLCVTEMREPPTKEDMMVTSRELDRIQTNHDDLARELARVNEQQGAILAQLATIQKALNVTPLPLPATCFSDLAECHDARSDEQVDHPEELRQPNCFSYR